MRPGRTQGTMPRQFVSDTEVYKLLNHPLRRRILAIVAESDTASSSQIADALSLPLNRITHHVRRLRDAGVLTVARVGTEGRPARSRAYYRLWQRPEDFDLGETPEGHDELASVWNEVGGIDGATRFDFPESLLAGRTIELDPAGCGQLSEATRKLTRRVLEIDAEVAARTQLDEESGGDLNAVALVMIFCEVCGERRDLEARIAARRADSEFQTRLHRIIDENRGLLDRLAASTVPRDSRPE